MLAILGASSATFGAVEWHSSYGRQRREAKDLKASVRRRILIGASLGSTLAWMAGLMLIAAWRNPRAPSVGPGVGSTLEPFLAHLVLFGILGILVTWTVYSIKGRQLALPAVIAASLMGLAWGAATEGYQRYVPGREPSIADVLTNLAGAIGGALLATALIQILRSGAIQGKLRG